MQSEFGEFLGICIVILYALTILNYVMKFLNRRFGRTLKAYPAFTHLLKFVVRNHKLFGILTVFFLVAHFIVQFNYYGLSVTGSIAAGILLVQVALGIYGAKSKSKGSKTWLIIHRTIAVALLVAILIHV